MQHRWAEGHRITLRGLATRATTHFDAGPGSDDLNKQRLASIALESDDRINEVWRSTVRLARGSDHLAHRRRVPEHLRHHQDQITWQNDLKFGTVDVIAGAEWRREDVTSDTAYTQTERRITSVFAGGRTTLDALQLEGSLRTDHNSQFGTHTTGRVGAGYALTPRGASRPAAGTAFPRPTFNDLYFPLSFGFSGNPDLKPSARGRGGRAALQQRRHHFSRGRVPQPHRRLIAVDPTFTTVVNVNRARIPGHHACRGHQAGMWRADFEWTHQDPRDTDTDCCWCDGRATTAAWALGRHRPVRAGADLQASDARFRTARPTCRPLAWAAMAC
jgi:vitamin B12 transporter